MKALRKSFLILLSLMLFLSVGLFLAACGDDGEGENPGGNGEQTAKDVAYTVDVYLEGEGGSYARSAEHSSSKTGKAGSSVTVSPATIDGYVFNASHAGTVLTKTLSENAAENVFSLYYDLVAAASSVEYNANAPAGTSVRGSVEGAAAQDGYVTAADNGFKIEGYRFAGWSTKTEGKAEYQPGEQVPVSGKVVLYAVWDQGLRDRFGGTDLIYLLSSEEGVAVLERGGVEFRGEYQGDGFTFKNDAGETVLEGKLFGTTFNYRRPEIEGSYQFYNFYMPRTEDEERLDPTETLTVDEYGSATHVYQDEQGKTVRQTGSIIYNAPTDEYLFTDTEGNGFVYALGVLPGDDAMSTEDDIPVFCATYGEGGSYQQFLTADGASGNLGGAQLILDGYGSAILDYDWYTGGYYVENVYDNGGGLLMYKIVAVFLDEFGVYAPVGTNYTVYCYTLPLNNGVYGFVQARSERGEYESASGKLVLDGFGVLPDSAVYTDATGNQQSGTYTISSSPRLTGTIITINLTEASGRPTGKTAQFLVNSEGFQPLSGTDKDEYKEYIWLNNGVLDFSPLLVLYDEDYTEGGVSGKRAEYWCYRDSKTETLELAANGYVTEEALEGGNHPVMYTWHKTGSVEGFESMVANELKFMLDATVDSNYLTRNVYIVFERDGEKLYSVLTDSEDSGAEIWYQSVGVNTLGSLYIDQDGNHYAGGFTVDTQGYYFGTVGLFIYYDETGMYHIIYSDLQLGTAGNPVSFTVLPENGADEVGMLLISDDGSMQTDATMLLRGNDQALYSASGDFLNAGAFVRGRLEYAGETALGDTIWAFVTDAGVEQFKLIYDYDQFVEYGMVTDIIVYHRYNARVAGTYTSASGELTLDGYRGASYKGADDTELSGYYHLSSDGTVVYLSAFTGEELVFQLDGKSFTALDGLYGEQRLYRHNTEYTLKFDGKGNVEAKAGNLSVGVGFYNFLNEEKTEVEVVIDLGFEGTEVIILHFGSGGISERAEEGKVYISDNWGVLILDGYGQATYYYEQGTGSATGHVTHIDRADGFIMIRYDESLTDQYFVIEDVRGSEYGRFSAPEYLRANLIYFSEGLKVIAYGNDGMAQIDNSIGCYNIKDGKAKVYIMNAQTGGYDTHVYPAPTGDKTYLVGEEMFYLFTGANGGRVTLTGTIRIGTEGFEDVEGVTLSFTISSSSLDGVDATLSVEGQSYSLLLTNHYIDPDTKRVVIGTALFDQKTYEYYPIEVHYIPSYIEGAEAVATFSAKGDISTTLVDYSDAQAHETHPERGISTLTESYVGFGPFTLSERKLSGTLYCGSVTLTFSGADIVEIYASPSENLYRYLAEFDFEDDHYAIIYEKEIDGYYTLYQVVKYDKMDAGNGYTVGVGRYFYSNEGYTFVVDYKAGNLSSVQLYKDGKILSAFNTLTNPRDNTAWMLLSDVDDTHVGYFFTVTMSDSGEPTAATVKEYTLVQGLTGEDASDSAYANFFIDKTTGEIKLVAFMSYVDGVITFMDIESVEVSPENEYQFTVVDTHGQEFTVTVVCDEESGEPLEDGAGQWLIVVT